MRTGSAVAAEADADQKVGTGVVIPPRPDMIGGVEFERPRMAGMRACPGNRARPACGHTVEAVSSFDRQWLPVDRRGPRFRVWTPVRWSRLSG